MKKNFWWVFDRLAILAGIATIVYFMALGISERPRSYAGLKSISVFEDMGFEPYDATVKPWTQGIRK